MLHAHAACGPQSPRATLYILSFARCPRSSKLPSLILDFARNPFSSPPRSPATISQAVTFTRYSFTSRLLLLCTNQSHHHILLPPPPALPTRLQYDCTTIPPPAPPFVCHTPNTIGKWGGRPRPRPRRTTVAQYTTPPLPLPLFCMPYTYTKQYWTQSGLEGEAGRAPTPLLYAKHHTILDTIMCLCADPGSGPERGEHRLIEWGRRVCRGIIFYPGGSAVWPQCWLCAVCAVGRVGCCVGGGGSTLWG